MFFVLCCTKPVFFVFFIIPGFTSKSLFTHIHGQGMENSCMQSWNQDGCFGLDRIDVCCHVVCMWPVHHMDHSSILWSHTFGRILPDNNMLLGSVCNIAERFQAWRHSGSCGCEVDYLKKSFLVGNTVCIGHNFSKQANNGSCQAVTKNWAQVICSSSSWMWHCSHTL